MQNPANLTANPTLDYFHHLQSFLETKMELNKSESTQKGTEGQYIIKIAVRNTAPIDPEWPKIVFTGIGLSAATIGEGPSGSVGINRLRPRISQPMVAGTTSNLPSKVTFNRISDGNSFPETTSDESSHGRVLFPGQSVTFEVDVKPESVPFLQFRVESTLSRRHLFHDEETLLMPESFIKPFELATFRALDQIDIFKGLDSVIASMPHFGNDTRLSEIQAFSSALNTGMAENKATQEAIGTTLKTHKLFWFQSLLQDGCARLDHITAAFSRMKDAMASNILERMVGEANSIVELKMEATQFKQIIQEMMSKHNISNKELKESGGDDPTEQKRTASQTNEQLLNIAMNKTELHITNPIQQNLDAQDKTKSDSGDDGDDDTSDADHSANDDRSDSMNPNNDAYQDSMDNRSDQMNPNNDAYWSSR